MIVDSRRAFLFFLFLFILLNPPPNPRPAWSEREYEERLTEERRELSLIGNYTYGDFDSLRGKWLPLVGLTKEDGFAWGLLNSARQKAKYQQELVIRASTTSDNDSGPRKDELGEVHVMNMSLPVYRNMTGKIHGDWVRWTEAETKSRPLLNLTAMAMEHEYFTTEFRLNATADHGELSMVIEEQESGDMIINGTCIRQVRAALTLETEEASEEMTGVNLYGVHIPGSGSIILTTTSEKFAGISALPHFAISRDAFELSRQLLNRSLSEAISDKQAELESFYPWSSLPYGPSTPGFTLPKCEYVVYLQQHPVMMNKHPAPLGLIQMIEDELRFPNGAPIPSPPLMVLSTVMFSPDCGFVIESKSSPAFSPEDGLYLFGPKREEYGKYSGRFMMIVVVILAAQTSLLLQQMKEASTPSTRSRISFYTIAMMSMGDALLVSFVFTELITQASFLIMCTVIFVAFFSVSFLAMKFQIDIWVVQAPERRGVDRIQTRTTNTNQTLPPPVTTPRSTEDRANTVIIPADQDEPETNGPDQNSNDNGAGAMYSRYYFVLLVLIFFTIWAIFWSRRVGLLYARIVSFAYFSFWIPQIYRNIMRNCRKALRWKFVIGQSLLRLAPFIYLYEVSGNVLFIHPSFGFISVLVGWVWLQIWILVSQDILGPRFFVPDGWAPPAYDYHPLLRDDSADGFDTAPETAETLPTGFLRAEERDAPDSSHQSEKQIHQQGRNRPRKIFDCAICMQDVEVPVLISDGHNSGAAASATAGASSILSRRTYMVTPCRHIFHSTCLETWMRMRLQCPICRESLPPI